MPAIDELLVGCNGAGVGNRRDRLWHVRTGLPVKYAGRCISCGCQVFVKESAWAMFRSWDHDPKLICEECDARYPFDSQRVMGIE